MKQNNKDKNINCKLKVSEIYFENEMLNIVFYSNGENNIVDNYTIEFTNRKTNEMKKVKLVEAKKDMFKVEINILEDEKFFKNSPTDIYIKDKKAHKKYRIKDYNIENIHDNMYIYENSNSYLEVYITENNNASTRIQKVKNEAIIDNINIDESGLLYIEGNACIGNFKLNSQNNISKEIALYAKGTSINSGQFFDLDIEEEIISSNTYYAKFKVKINCNNENIKDLYNKELNIKFRFKNDDNIKYSIAKLENDERLQSYTQIYLNENFDIELTKNDKNIIKIKINKVDELAHINTVYTRNNKIEVKGTLIGELKNNNDMYVALRLRDTLEEIVIDCNIVDNKFDFVINSDIISNKSNLELTVYDLYIVSKEKEYRLVNILDKVANKKSIITLPQIITTNQDGYEIDIKPYYTAYDELSILTRNRIELKNIQEIKIINDDIIINGKLNIQTQSEPVFENANGMVYIEATYGRKFVLPYECKLKYTEKTALEHEFEIKILKKSYESKNIKIEDIINNLSFNLVKLEIKLDKGISTTLLNIDPSKIKSNSEIKMEKNKVSNDFINKNALKLYRLFNKMPIKKNIAIFQSFHGKNYACNPKAIYERLLEENKNIKSVWVLNDLNKEIPGNPIIVRPRSIKYYYYMARAKYFVNNGNFPDFYKKRKNTVHLQTWHGTPLKRLGFDINESSPSYKENTSDELMARINRWDYLVAPNQYTEEILTRAFKYDKEVIESGYPRNDILYNYDGSQIQKIKEKLNIPKDKKIILYAPTWKDYEYHEGAKNKPYKFKFDMDSFVDKFGSEYVLLLRLHYRDAVRIKINGYENVVYNVSSYDDIQELYLISDILMTDYSSVMFDYSNLNRPIIFFTYDLEKYSSELRGFYFDLIEEAPGPIVQNEESLYDIIENIENVKVNYKERYDNFREKFCNWDDGNASSKVIEKVFK